MTAYFTNVGKAETTNRIIGAGTQWTYVAWGTGSTAGFSAATTALVTEGPEARVNGTGSRVTSASPAVTNDTYRVTATITASAARTPNQAGVFTASTSGNMCVFGDHSATTLASGESIAYTIDVTFT